MIRRFNRFELKYILPVMQCANIIEDLRHQISPDSHGGTEGYPVVSLYYDSAAFDFFWAKIEGLKFRRKVRLRIYPGDDITKVTEGSIEIKQRINKTVQKRRLLLPLDQAKDLCAGNLPLSGLDALDMQVASEITYLSRSMDLRPAAITAYWRRAYEGHDENDGVRVTFDTRVASRIHALTVNATATNRLILPEDWCIMELKADDRVPEWMTSLLARHGCQLTRVSKYCAGVATLKGINVMPLTLGPGVIIPSELSVDAVPKSTSGSRPPASGAARRAPSNAEPAEDPLDPEATPKHIPEPPHG